MESRQAHEERQFPRYAVHCKVSVQPLRPSGITAENLGAVEGEIQNISSGGFCFLADRPSELASVLRCEISFPGAPIAIPTLAHVRWSRPDEHGGYAAGVRFLLD